MAAITHGSRWTLTDLCSEFFANEDCLRGNEYARNGSITIVAVGTLGFHAYAVGTQRYNVFVDWSNLKNGLMYVHCDCRRFRDTLACKHLWASMLVLDEFHVSPFAQQHCRSMLPLNEDAFEIGDPIDIRTRPRLRADHKGASKWTTWQKQLKNVAKIVSNHSEKLELLAQNLARFQPQLWFCISEYELDSESPFEIHFYESKRKIDGDWSIPMKSSMSRRQAQSIVDLEIRNLLARLECSENDSSYFGFHYASERPRWTLPQDRLRETLQALCQTSRFVLGHDIQTSLQAYQPILLDEGPDWRFQLHLSRTGAKETIEVEAILARPLESQEHPTVERMPLNQVLAYCDSGAILFDDKVGILRKQDVNWARAWKDSKTLKIPPNELDAFMQQLMQFGEPPSIECHSDLGISTILGSPVPKLVLSTTLTGNRNLRADVAFGYSQETFSIDAPQTAFWDRERKAIVERDLAQEQKWLDQLSSFPLIQQDGIGSSLELRIHRTWFRELIQRLVSQGWEVVAEGKVVRTSRDFQIKVTSGEDWFDLNADCDFGGHIISLPTLLQALKKGEKWISLGDGTHAMLPDEWLEKVAKLTEFGELQGDAVRFQRNQGLLLDMLIAEQESITVDRDFTAWCKQIRTFKGIKPAKQPKGFQGTLRVYQREGLGWFQFLQEFGFGGCLADDMGLGKTIQILALLEARRTRKLQAQEPRKPSIAIVPKSLVFNWIEEGTRFTPSLKIVDYTGSDREVELRRISESDLVVTTYHTFRRDVEQLTTFEFDYAILDEAQAIKNPQSQASKAVRLIKANHRLAMTGTPIENHLGDLWSLFNFLNPGMLGSSTASSFTLDDDSERIEALSKALRPFILRRTKEQVLTELPSKTEQTLYCELAPKQRKLYAELRDHYRNSLAQKVEQVGIQRAKIHVLEALLRLRQAACDPRLIDPHQKLVGSKIELLMEQLAEVLQEKHKVLVFSQFTSLLGLVRKEIESRGWSCEYLDGQTKKRDACVKRFQEDPDCRIFLISLKAGGLGLNLTAAEYVFILDPWWNPAAEAQAIDRAHRMGQTKPVMAYRMIARGTVEEKIVQLQDSKRELADAIVSANESLLRKLSMEDLQILFD